MRRWPVGMTLIEALLGTALLGTLLVAILLAQSRLHRQAIRADSRLEACRVADKVMEGWWPKRATLPRSGTGAIEGQKNWTWRTRPRDDESAKAMNMQVVVLEILPAGKPELGPAASLEIVLPNER